MIVPDWLRQQAIARPAHPALVDVTGRALSYAELERRVDGVHRRLLAAGLMRGARVATLLPNGLAAIDLIHAVPRAGAVLVPLDPRSSEEEAAARAAAARPRLVVGCAATAPAARGAAAACDARLALVEPDAAALEEEPSIDTELAPPLLDLAAEHSVVFTSGTTGSPRGVVLRGANHLWSALGSAERLGVRRDDRWLACLPLHHIGGLAVVLRAAIYGTTVVLQPRFEPEAVLRAVRDHAVTQLSLVPTALWRLLQSSALDPRATSLRVLLLGGARAAPELVAAALDAGWPVAPTYGLTEAASQVATCMPGDAAARRARVGQPLACAAVRIVAADGRLASPGEVGEIQLRGPTIALGALDPEDAGALRPIARDDGWLATADQGLLEPDGTLSVIGRRDDVIVTGGENVAPEEIEAVLLEQPDVADVAVAGVEDPEWGQAVCAWVVPRPGCQPELGELRRACAARLAPHELPRRLVLAENLPRTASGKLQRRKLELPGGRP